jgi:hypothetical protein
VNPTRPKDAREVDFEITPRSEPRGGVEQRWKDGQENDFGIQRDSGNPRNKAEQQPRHHQHDGIRRAQPAGESGEQDDEHQQGQQDDFNCVDTAARRHTFALAENTT